MKRKLFLLAIFCSIITLIIIQSQKKEEDPSELIEKLSWNSLYDHSSYDIGDIKYNDHNVDELLKIGQPAIQHLIKSIDKPEKTVVIHIILTNILEPENCNNYLREISIKENCVHRIGYHYIFNGLVWEKFLESGDSIQKSEINKVKKYWTNRVKGKAILWENNVEQILKQLNISDSIKYPCDKNFENNSEELLKTDLSSHFNTKVNTVHLKEVFDKLGNDSIISILKDGFYISYHQDCIDFRFDEDSLLIALFFEPGYKGWLPYDLEYSDKKKEVEQKIGVPDKQEQLYLSETVLYQRKKIQIKYNENKEIVEFLFLKTN